MSLTKISEADKILIKTVFEIKYSEAVRNRDKCAYLELYTDDAIWIPPNDIDRVGKDQIAIGFANMILTKNIDATFVSQEIEGTDVLAYVLGTSDAVITPLDQSPATKSKFRALWIMKKEQDNWKIYRQIWNNKPVE